MTTSRLAIFLRVPLGQLPVHRLSETAASDFWGQTEVTRVEGVRQRHFSRNPYYMMNGSLGASKGHISLTNGLSYPSRYLDRQVRVARVLAVSYDGVATG